MNESPIIEDKVPCILAKLVVTCRVASRGVAANFVSEEEARAPATGQHLFSNAVASRDDSFFADFRSSKLTQPIGDELSVAFKSLTRWIFSACCVFEA